MGAPQDVPIPLSCTPHCPSVVTYIETAFFIVLECKFNKAKWAWLETLRLLEIFQEFSSVFFNVKSSFVSIANTDFGDINSLPLLLGSSSPLSWITNHFMGYWDCRWTLFKYCCWIRVVRAFWEKKRRRQALTGSFTLPSSSCKGKGGQRFRDLQDCVSCPLDVLTSVVAVRNRLLVSSV